jgi:hypothetical protein
MADHFPATGKLEIGSKLAFSRQHPNRLTLLFSMKFLQLIDSLGPATNLYFKLNKMNEVDKPWEGYP